MSDTELFQAISKLADAQAELVGILKTMQGDKPVSAHGLLFGKPVKKEASPLPEPEVKEEENEDPRLWDYHMHKAQEIEVNETMKQYAAAGWLFVQAVHKENGFYRLFFKKARTNA